jgi:jouberin
VKIYNVETGLLKYTLKGHKNLIHDMDWDSTSSYFLTSSSDSTCKVWKLIYPEHDEEVEEEDSERLLHICTLHHPSFVYSAKFYKQSELDRPIIASACFDNKIRLWRVELEFGKHVRHGKLFDGVLIMKRC